MTEAGEIPPLFALESIAARVPGWQERVHARERAFVTQAALYFARHLKSPLVAVYSTLGSVGSGVSTSAEWPMISAPSK
jgi:hypothetical protein